MPHAAGLTHQTSGMQLALYYQQITYGHLQDQQQRAAFSTFNTSAPKWKLPLRATQEEQNQLKQRCRLECKDWNQSSLPSAFSSLAGSSATHTCFLTLQSASLRWNAGADA